ncbi:MAG: hypothetical protein KJ040_09975 [Gammaproteobacteria bacterium]|nr:hypothetical protein [Gammaproteobacteria bacterium]
MTGYGRMNLAGMLLLPVAASLAALIAFGPRSDTLITVFALNLVPMLIGGLVSWLLLRGAARAGKGQGIALWPTIIPAVFGAAWYLWRAVMPAEVAPGAEYIAGPQYLLIAVIVLGIVAWIGCRIARAR